MTTSQARRRSTATSNVKTGKRRANGPLQALLELCFPKSIIRANSLTCAAPALKYPATVSVLRCPVMAIKKQWQLHISLQTQLSFMLCWPRFNIKFIRSSNADSCNLDKIHARPFKPQ